MLFRKGLKWVAAASTLAILVSLTSGAALAGPRGARHGAPEPGMFMGRIFDHLDLDPEQREQLTAIVAEHRAGMKEQMEQLRTARSAVDDSIHAAEFNEAAIRETAAALATLEADHAVTRALHFQEVRRVLTEDQWVQFEEMRQNLHQHRHGRHEPGHGGPGGFQGERP